MHLHTVHMEYFECQPTLLNPLAERTCFSQAPPRGCCAPAPRRRMARPAPLRLPGAPFEVVHAARGGHVSVSRCTLLGPGGPAGVSAVWPLVCTQGGPRTQALVWSTLPQHRAG
jgi:hypothetical protein